MCHAIQRAQTSPDDGHRVWEPAALGPAQYQPQFLQRIREMVRAMKEF